MASIIPRQNGTYLIRVSCGLDESGKQITRSKTFRPSKPNLSYQRLNREIDQFVADFEMEVKTGGKSVDFDKITFSQFCDKYLELKKTTLSPNTMVFYEMIIRTELRPMFGAMKMRDIMEKRKQSIFKHGIINHDCLQKALIFDCFIVFLHIQLVCISFVFSVGRSWNNIIHFGTLFKSSKIHS